MLEWVHQEVIILDQEKIAQKLRGIRGDRTLAEMASLLGVTTSAVGNYEQASRMPRDETKMKYAEISGLSVEEIFYA